MSKSWKNIFFLIFLFSLVFDYRRLEGDNVNLVVILGVISFFASLGLIINIKNYFKKNLILYFLFVGFSFSAVISGFFRGQELYAILAQILPFLIFSNAFLISSSYIRNPNDINNILRIVVVSAIFSAIWKIFFTFSYYGLDMQNVRYQILSGGVIVLFSYGVTSFFVAKSKYYLLALILSLGVVLASVTRTYLLIYMCIIFSCIVAIPFNRIANYLYKGFLISSVILFILFILIYLNPSFEERWMARLFSGEIGESDLTALTRISESKGQIELIKNDIWGALFGFGIAAKTYWSGPEVNEIIRVLGAYFDTTGYSYGHNVYIGILYVGGFILGFPIVVFIFLLPFIGLVKFKKIYSKINESEKFIALFAISSAFGYLVYGFFSGTFGDRSMSLYYGLVLGLLFRFIYLKI